MLAENTSASAQPKRRAPQAVTHDIVPLLGQLSAVLALSLTQQAGQVLAPVVPRPPATGFRTAIDLRVTGVPRMVSVFMGPGTGSVTDCDEGLDMVPWPSFNGVGQPSEVSLQVSLGREDNPEASGSLPYPRKRTSFGSSDSKYANAFRERSRADAVAGKCHPCS